MRHVGAALRTLAREAGLAVDTLGPGVLEVTGDGLDALVVAAGRALTPTEVAEVRALLVPAGTDADRLALLALTAPTLATAGGRLRHADLLPLFADEQSRFYSLYQPIVDLGTGAVVGHEALLRGSGPDGEIPPGHLFGAAAEAGWTHVLDRVGRTSALTGARGWLGEDLLFINFLPTSIYRPEVCLRTTERAAEVAGLRMEQLVFEVTETEPIHDVGHLSDVFAYYRDRGCKVALDDLGSGYSSLNLLVRLRPDVVKLDKEIVQALPHPAAAAVVSAAVEITRSYGGTVLAECVETEEQAAAARDLGVELGQGWHFGRPVRRQVASPPSAGRVALDPARPDPAVAEQLAS